MHASRVSVSIRFKEAKHKKGGMRASTMFHLHITASGNFRRSSALSPHSPHIPSVSLILSTNGASLWSVERFRNRLPIKRGKHSSDRFSHISVDMEDPDAAGLEIDVISSSNISKTMLKECFGIEPTKSESERLGNNTLGISGCHVYHCSFDLENNLDKFLYVVDHFCKMFEGDAYIEADPLMDDLLETVESTHKYLRVDHFSLGAWTGLSGFIEKFSSTRAKSPYRSIGRIQCSFHHDRRFLELYFEDKISVPKAVSPVYKLKVAYDDIKKIVMKRELRHLDAFYGLNRKKEPMEVFLHVAKISAYTWRDLEINAYDYFFDGEWDRTPNFGASGGPTYCGGVGAFNVIKLKLDVKEAYPADAIYALLRTADVPAFFASVRTHEMPRNPQPLTCDKGSSDIQYALACINSRAPELSLKIALDQNNKEIQDLLARLAAEDGLVLTAALYEIYHAIHDCPINDMKLAIDDAYKKAKSSKNGRILITKEKLPQNMYLVKKVTVCPSRTIVEPPTVVRVNILLHELDPEKVMLVDIRDDDRRKLRCENLDEARTFIQKSIAERVKKGIKLAGRTYFFLGSSRCQSEDSSFWAYAIDKKGSESINSIRQRLGIEGDLTAKVAVQDLVFAEALGCVEIDPEWVAEEDQDLPPAEDFKLGIGRISRDALGFIIDQCYPAGHPCSAIRVAHGGRKGTLVYDPSLDGNQIIYRKSQIVFSSEDRYLYLIETNEVKNGVFDKVFISTLSSKLDGQRDEFTAKDFLSPVYELLSDSLLPFVKNPPKDTFVTEPLLPHLIQGQSLRRYDTNGDGLFRQAKRCRQLKALRGLKMLKERIKCAYELMPVVDEAGVLEEGEVFIQFAERGGDFTIVDSTVVIARKDAMHPAELLRVNAVNRPEVVSVLGHLTNCVVLPARGESNTLGLFSRGASYAEGANVIVIANTPDSEPKFIFKRNDRVCSTTVGMGPEVNPDCDIETHYFNYLRTASYNDFEEVFCALSDTLPQHAYSESCLRVALQRRLLEEYRRGGREISALQKISNFPDFLDKISNRRTYCSIRPIGHVFRRVKFLDVGYFENTEIEYDEITLQSSLEMDGSMAFGEVAKKDFAIFKQNLEAVASLYKISVGELLTGTIFSIPGDQLSDERLRNLETTVKLHVKYLATLCERQFKRGMKKASDTEVLQKISAYYATSRLIPECECEGGYALPWMFPDLMQNLIKHCKPKSSLFMYSKLQKRILRFTQPLDDEKIKATVMENMFGILKKWLDVNREACALTRADANYYSEKLTEFETAAFESAFRIFMSVEDGLSLRERLERDCLSLLAETLRQMVSSFAEAADKKFSTLQFSMMHIQTLLLNTLIRIAASCSLWVLMKPKDILRKLVVSHRMLLPLGTKDTPYIQTTHTDLQRYEEMLRDFTSCERVKVRAVPRAETSECDYEEIIAKGAWFAVANLEFVIMQPDFRSTVADIFEVERVRKLSLNVE